MAKILRNDNIFDENQVNNRDLYYRVSTLENHEYKIVYFDIITNSTTGIIKIPSFTQFSLDEYGNYGSISVSRLSQNNKPSYESPVNSTGVTVLATLNTVNNQYTLSSTPIDTTLALIYTLKVKSKYYHYLNIDKILSSERITTIQGGSGGSNTFASPLVLTGNLVSIPSANADRNGYLTMSDWTTFNSKQSALGFTPENVSNKENTTLDNSPTKYPTNNLVKTALDNKQSLLTGTQYNIPFWGASNVLSQNNNFVFKNNNLGLGTTNPLGKFSIIGSTGNLIDVRTDVQADLFKLSSTGNLTMIIDGGSTWNEIQLFHNNYGLYVDSSKSAAWFSSTMDNNLGFSVKIHASGSRQSTDVYPGTSLYLTATYKNPTNISTPLIADGLILHRVWPNEGLTVDDGIGVSYLIDAPTGRPNNNLQAGEFDSRIIGRSSVIIKNTNWHSRTGEYNIHLQNAGTFTNVLKLTATGRLQVENIIATTIGNRSSSKVFATDGSILDTSGLALGANYLPLTLDGDRVLQSDNSTTRRLIVGSSVLFQNLHLDNGLAISNGVSDQGDLVYSLVSSYVALRSLGSNRVSLVSNAGERVTVTSSGRVGINATTPNSQLDVFGNTGGNSSLFKLRSSAVGVTDIMNVTESGNISFLGGLGINLNGLLEIADTSVNIMAKTGLVAGQKFWDTTLGCGIVYTGTRFGLWGNPPSLTTIAAANFLSTYGAAIAPGFIIHISSDNGSNLQGFITNRCHYLTKTYSVITPSVQVWQVI